MRTRRLAATLICCLAPISFFGCTDPGDEHDDEHDHDHDTDHDHNHETEVISRVELTFTPDDGGDAIVAAFSDPDGDGGMSGTSDGITLTSGVGYTLTVGLFNDLEDPPEDIGEEIQEEAEEHQFFFADDGGLLTIDYADIESDYADNAVGEDLPVGVVNTVAVNSAGTSELRVLLRHLPPFNDEPQKVPGLAEVFSSGGDLPGDVDVDVTFTLTVE